MATFGWPCYNAGMNTDLPVPPQFAHMAKAACLLLMHPTDPELFAVCSRRNSTVHNFPGGKQDPGEIMAQTASRETQEEIGVLTDPKDLEFLFADAIPGDTDYWVECFVAKSPTDVLAQMEPGITVHWTNWAAFTKNNAFKGYNDAIHLAHQTWKECQRLGVPYAADLSHLSTNLSLAV